MTAEPQTEGSPELEFRGRITIEWPKWRVSSPVLACWATVIRDADTGKVIPTAARIVVDAGSRDWITAELTQLVGTDGQPARPGPRDLVTGRTPPLAIDIGDDGKPKTAVFRYIVTRMSVAES